MRISNQLIKGLMSFLFFLLTNNSSFAQVNQQWISTYNGKENSFDGGNDIAADKSGNVYVTGICTETGTGYDYTTLKYNSSGMQQWISIYNGTGNSDDIANSIAVDNSENVYVTGSSFGNGSLYDFTTIKYNSSGIVQWVARYNGTGNSFDEAFSMGLDDSGNVYVTGASIGAGTSEDIVTIKYNSEGLQKWVARYNGFGNGNDVAYSLAVDSSGSVYVSGSSTGISTLPDYTTIKYNSDGIQQWIAIYNGPGNGADYSNDIGIDRTGNVYVTGYSDGGIVTFSDYSTIKYNSAGEQQWVQRYNGRGSSDDYAKSIAVDNAGNVYVTGECLDSVSYYDIVTIKYNSTGEQQWAEIYNGPAGFDDAGNSIAVDNSGDVYVAGYSSGIGTSNDYTTIKYNSSGVVKWIKTYDNINQGDDAMSIITDTCGNIYVTGYSTSIAGGTDIATIKYSQLTDIIQFPDYMPARFILFQNYPNPFNPSTNLGFEISNSEFVSLKVYDQTGREIAVLVDEKLSRGRYNVTFDGNNCTSGVYFYKISSVNYSITKKMLLIK